MTDQPVLRVITPDATPEEIAALVAVFASLQSQATPAPTPRSVWAAPARGHRRPLQVSRGGWRSSVR
ncbi:putative Acetyl-CoA carboxylase, epsilon subunit [metagenome]|uniref:Putative Acetyl-CoA carboxylase, epsilon subunit n=1 Tax=metagenome TaxID=256318 RepID=A0A2P2C522_9ZZZZ